MPTCLGLQGCLQSTAHNVLPVNRLEPRMLLDGGCATLGASESLAWVSNQQLRDEVLGISGEVVRPLDVPLQNLLVDSQRLIIVERRVTSQHLKHKNTKAQ